MSLKYDLNLEIDPEDLKILKQAQLKITIAKPTSQDAGGPPSVTWLVFDPFQSNKVDWEEVFGMYASATPSNQNGAVINKMSSLPSVADAKYYSFDASATFSGPFSGSDSPDAGSFRVNNKMPYSQYPVLTFGLTQAATVNNSSVSPTPLNAAPVPSQISATFTPITTVYVWVQAQFTSGTVITNVNGDAVMVQYQGGTNSHTLKWDPTQGKFAPVSETGDIIDFEDSPCISPYIRQGVH